MKLAMSGLALWGKYLVLESRVGWHQWLCCVIRHIRAISLTEKGHTDSQPFCSRFLQSFPSTKSVETLPLEGADCSAYVGRAFHP